jgi:hypothetical protein
MSDDVNLHPAPAGHGGPALAEEPPIYRADLNISQVNRELTAAIFRRPNAWWWAAFLVALTMLSIGSYVVYVQLNVSASSV